MKTKYEQFLADNRPADFAVPARWLKQAMDKLGFFYEEESQLLSLPIRVLRDIHGNAVGLPKGQKLRGVYTTDTETPGVVIYRPRIYGGCSSRWVGEKGVDILKTLAGELGDIAPEFTIRLPERVVELPLPPWYEVLDSDDWAYVKSTLMFESEARTALDAYISSARNALDTVSPK